MLEVINFDETIDVFVSKITPMNGSDFTLLTIFNPSPDILEKYCLQDISSTFMMSGGELLSLLERNDELFYLDSRFGIVPVVDFFGEFDFERMIVGM